MKLMSLIVIGLVIAVHSVQAAAASSNSDAELSRQLVGTWENGKPQGIITFHADHSVTGFWIIRILDLPPARVDIKGDWRIEGGILKGNISSSNPTVAPAGKLKPIRIISIASNGALLQDASGRKERHPRARIPHVLPPLVSPDIALFIAKPKMSKAVIKESALEQPQPTYPQTAIRDHTTGSGLFGLLVDKSTGRVQSVRTLIGTGHEILDDAARGALARWRFKSNSIDKAAVPVEFRLTKRGPLGIFGL